MGHVGTSSVFKQGNPSKLQHVPNVLCVASFSSIATYGSIALQAKVAGVACLGSYVSALPTGGGMAPFLEGAGLTTTKAQLAGQLFSGPGCGVWLLAAEVATPQKQ